MSECKASPDLKTLLSHVQLAENTRVYKVSSRDLGSGPHKEMFVVANSPGQACLACCRVERVEKDTLLRAAMEALQDRAKEQGSAK